VIAPLNQNDFRIASFQSASRGDSSKSAADNHDTLRPHTRLTCYWQALAVSEDHRSVPMPRTVALTAYFNRLDQPFNLPLR
jgi:hypothetical protein